MRRRRSRRRDFTRLYILIAVMVAALAGVFAANLFGEEENQQAAESGLTVESNFSHIMVMGVDRRSDDVGRSDTLMVVTVDTDAGKGEIMSLPRDTRVQIEKNGYDKINHAYAYGGSKLTRKTVEDLLGVPMDYYVLVDLKAFERIIDALDGIDINVEKRMYYEDPWDDNGGLVIDLYPGMQHLDGERAIQYVRYRDGEGDIGRINRQQHFMQAVMDKVLSPQIITKLPKIIEEVYSAVETDMPVSEMLSMAKLLPKVKANGLESVMVPGTPAYLEDVSYWLPDIMSLRQIIASQMGQELTGKALEKAKAVKAMYEKSLPEGLTVMEGSGIVTTRSAKNDTADSDDSKAEKDSDDSSKEEKQSAKAKKKSAKAEGPGEISVLIINDSGINGAGAKMANVLREKGFNVTGIDTGRKSDRTHTIIITDDSNTDWFYGMPFSCTIMDGSDPNEAVVYIGQDYE